MVDLNKDLSNKKQRLGRGMSSLLGEASSMLQPENTTTKPTATAATVDQNHPRVWSIAINKVVASEFQPRSTFDKQKLEELAQSIKQNGILQPIVARKRNDGQFEIIAGERRFRAAQLAGLHEVPIILKTFTNRETLELALIENIQREDLNVIEQARAIQRLVAEFSLTQQQVAERLGKDRSSVANLLRLLQLPAMIQEKILQGTLSFGHAKVLLAVQEPQALKEFAEKTVQEQLSVRTLEKLILKEQKKPIQEEKQAHSSQDRVHHIVEELQKALGTKVAVDYQGGKGKISIQFYTNDQFTQLVEKLKG